MSTKKNAPARRPARGKKATKRANARAHDDAQLEEFETRDLGDDFRAAGTAIAIRPGKGVVPRSLPHGAAPATKGKPTKRRRPSGPPQFLYTCTAQWTADRDRSNAGSLRFYTSIAALKAGEKCWRECGIVRIRAEPHSVAVRGSDPHMAAIDIPPRAAAAKPAKARAKKGTPPR